MLENRREYPCQTIQISPGGLSIIAPVRGEIGERVIIYIDLLGRIEGDVISRNEIGFGVQIVSTLKKREALADQLTWLANRHSLGLPEDRRHERIVPRNNQSSIKLNDFGYPARIVDVSMFGAAVVCNADVKIGDTLVLGETEARVVRQFEGGFALQFRNQIDPAIFSENINL